MSEELGMAAGFKIAGTAGAGTDIIRPCTHTLSPFLMFATGVITSANNSRSNNSSSDAVSPAPCGAAAKHGIYLSIGRIVPSIKA